jgi:hypothetical protein
MKTPMQELIDIIKQRINDDDSIPYMYNERILELAESMLEKEKEVMCEFAEYTRKCGFLSDQRGLMTTEELYDQTFNTKEK